MLLSCDPLIIKPTHPSDAIPTSTMRLQGVRRKGFGTVTILGWPPPLPQYMYLLETEDKNYSKRLENEMKSFMHVSIYYLWNNDDASIRKKITAKYRTLQPPSCPTYAVFLPHLISQIQSFTLGHSFTAYFCSMLMFLWPDHFQVKLMHSIKIFRYSNGVCKNAERMLNLHQLNLWTLSESNECRRAYLKNANQFFIPRK